MFILKQADHLSACHVHALLYRTRHKYASEKYIFSYNSGKVKKIFIKYVYLCIKKHFTYKKK